MTASRRKRTFSLVLCVYFTTLNVAIDSLHTCHRGEGLTPAARKAASLPATISRDANPAGRDAAGHLAGECPACVHARTCIGSVPTGSVTQPTPTDVPAPAGPQGPPLLCRADRSPSAPRAPPADA